MTATAADLENAARDAASNDPSSIETLAHAVMTYPHVYRLPPELAEMLETELARSEIAYRNGTGKSVKEEEVLKLLNDISAKFHMPGYCRTTPVQVRNLRMKLAINLPSFMGRGLADRQSATRGQVEDTMSPLQAMHLFAVMVDQKVLNPLYQDPSLDLVRAEEEQRKAVEKARLTRGIRTKAFLMQSVNPHGLEVRQAMSKGAESMTVSDAFKLASEALKTLGLN